MSGDTVRVAADSVDAAERVAEPAGVVRLLLRPASVVAALVLVRLPWLHAVPVTQDEAIVLLYGQQILEGRLPHRDFYTVYGPGTFALTAGGFALLGSSLLVERLVGLMLQAVVVAGVYRLALPRGRGVAFAASLLSVLCLAPLSLAAYAWLAGLGCIVWGLVLLQGRRHLPLAAALLALTALFRPEMTVPAFAVLVPFLRSRTDVRSLAIGFGTGLAPSVAYYATWGRRALDNAVLERGFVNAKHEFDGVVLVILGLVAGMAAVLVHAAWRHRRSETLSWATLVLFMLPQLVQRTDLDHFAYVASIAAPLAFLALSEGSTTPSQALRTRRVVLVLAVAVLVVPWRLLSPAPPAVSYQVAGRSMLVEPSDVRVLDEIRETVLRAVPPGSRLFVGTHDMRLPAVTPVELYFLFPELRADAYYLELPIGISPTAGRRIANDIRGADVLVLASFPEDVARRLNPFVPLGPSDPNDAVRSSFCPAGGAGGLRIMVRCSTAKSTPEP